MHSLRSQLSSNYIKIELEQDKGFYKYVVDYKPPIDAKPLRFKLLNGHRDKFPVKMFDGTLLYIPKKLPQDVIIYLFSEKYIVLIVSFI